MISEESFRRFIRERPAPVVVPVLMLYGLVPASLTVLAVLGIAELGRLISAKAPLYIYMMYLSIVTFGGTLIRTMVLKPDEDKEFFGGGFAIAIAITYSLAFSVLFGLFCREWSASSPGGFSELFQGSRVEWAKFGLDNYLEAVFFDIPSIYHLKLSDINPERFSTRTAVLFCRLYVDYILIAMLLGSYGHFKALRKDVA